MTNQDRTSLPTTNFFVKLLKRLIPDCILSRESEDIATQTTTLLYLKLVTHIRARTEDSSQKEDINTIIQQLSLACEISSKKIKKNLEKLNNAMIRDLEREFHSVDQVFESVLSGDTSFDDALVKYLKQNLNILRPPKHSRLNRFCDIFCGAFPPEEFYL